MDDASIGFLIAHRVRKGKTHKDCYRNYYEPGIFIGRILPHTVY